MPEEIFASEHNMSCQYEKDDLHITATDNGRVKIRDKKSLKFS